jgi:uncharacterized membrane protein
MNENWYYAKDGKPEGPLDRAAIIELFREGKIAPDGLVWQDGTPDWVMASSVFAKSASATGGANPSFGGSGQIDFAECFSEGWNVFKIHWPMMVAAGAIFFLISAVIQGPFQVIQVVMKEVIDGNFALLAGLIGLSYIVSLIFTPPLTAGFFQFCLETLRDKPRLEVLFQGFKECWLQTVLCALVMGLLVILGFICLIVPGIYLSIAYYYAIPLIIDRKMGFWEAMELSRQTVHKQWFMVFAVVVVSGLLSAVGILLCCVGIIGSLPLGYLVAMQSYRQLFAAAPSASSIQ